MNNDLSQNLIELKGIGPKTYQKLEKNGIVTYLDLLNFFPKDYIEYKEPIKYKDLEENYFVTICGKFVSRPFLRRGRIDVVTAKLKIDGGLVDLVWFRMPYIPSTVNLTSNYYIYGRIKKKNGKYIIEQGTIFTKEKYEKRLQSLTPVYHLFEGISNNFIEKSINEIIKSDNFKNDKISSQDTFMKLAKEACIELPKENIYKVMHFPINKDEFLRTRNYLVFKEFLVFLLSIRKGRKREEDVNCMKQRDTKLALDIINKLPFELTNDQKNVLENMLNTMSGDEKLECLLQGDVGSGKTIIAFVLMLYVAINDYQAVMMAPTEVLANQHFAKMKKMINDFNLPFNVELITGSIKGKQRKEALERVAKGESQIIIGTHALLQEKVQYKNVALVITDEQHKFGVKQREKLYNKGNSPHFLVMSATPIPRTLSLILYGDLKMETIKTMPKGRKPIKNLLISSNERVKAHALLKREIEAGRQGYVICPLVDFSETRSGENVIEYTKKLADLFKGVAKVGTLHGKMSEEEKNGIMQDFKEHKIDILVSTTVVEVGIDVPNATCMVIENADTFGLASLHQLRGRIGRGNFQSYCVFVNGSKKDSNKRRLEVISNTNDGFKIADEDLKARGPGELFGIRQAGQLKFDFGDLYQDSEILGKASKLCDEILEKDKELASEKYSFLKFYIKDLNIV